MAYPPTQVTITYISTWPNTTSTATLNIPNGCSYSDFVAAIMRSGFWFPQPANASNSQTQTFTPANQIVSMAAS